MVIEIISSDFRQLIKILCKLQNTNILYSSHSILNLLINQSFIINFLIAFFPCTEMSKDSSVKYYQNNKERLQKKFREKYQSLFEQEKEKKRTIWT